VQCAVEEGDVPFKEKRGKATDLPRTNASLEAAMLRRDANTYTRLESHCLPGNKV